MAVYPESWGGDSPWDYESKIDQCDHCDETEKFYEEKLFEIRKLLTPLIKHLRRISLLDKETIDDLTDKMLDIADFNGHQASIFKLKEEK